MTPRDFIYWLQGFMEVANPETITKEQVEMIKRHLSLTFINLTAPETTIVPIPQPFTTPPWGPKDYDEIYKPTIYCATNVPPICTDVNTTC